MGSESAKLSPINAVPAINEPVIISERGPYLSMSHPAIKPNKGATTSLPTAFPDVIKGVFTRATVTTVVY